LAPRRNDDCFGGGGDHAWRGWSNTAVTARAVKPTPP
jgi:hypothetical protein